MNPIDRYADALEAEGKKEAAARREASKLEPITIVISDQLEIRRLHELVASKPYKQQIVPFIRGHLREWGRQEMERARLERAG